MKKAIKICICAVFLLALLVWQACAFRLLCPYIKLKCSIAGELGMFDSYTWRCFYSGSNENRHRLIVIRAETKMKENASRSQMSPPRWLSIREHLVDAYMSYITEHSNSILKAAAPHPDILKFTFICGTDIFYLTLCPLAIK